MKITAKDIFTGFYEAFTYLQGIDPSDRAEDIETAKVEVEKILNDNSATLEKYVDMRVKRMVLKMKENGDIK